MIRVATFNVENLFDRPKIINLLDTAKSSQLLEAAGRLQKELGKVTYDKARIEELLDILKGYVTVRVDRGRFFAGQSKTKVAAKGRGDWEGAIEFTRARFSDEQRTNTAQVIRDIDADVMCLVEVESRQSLLAFMREYFKPAAKRLERNMLIDSPIDPRGIDIGIVWRGAELGVIRSNVYDRRMVNGKWLTVWSRDCLEVELQVGGGKSLWVLGNHFKSKLGGDPPEAREKRRAQAERLAEILRTRYDLKRDWVVVMGDLNDVPGSEALAPLYGVTGLHDVFDVAGMPVEERWTYYFERARAAERRTQIDYIFVSAALKGAVTNVRVHRRGMSAVAEGKIPGIKPYPGITSWRDAASDHAAISVDLEELSLMD
jgi:endonuclease/exonuclease/phosphatase family metal-dependent hydrolase